MQITYCFVSPFSTADTANLIAKAFSKIGTVQKVDTIRGRVSAKYRRSSFRNIKMEFYIQHDDESCKVRAIINEELFQIKSVLRQVDSWWDRFLAAMFAEKPNADFGVSLANQNAYIVGVLYLGDETHQVHRSRTTGGTSLLGFLTGGALFGPAGAIVGGMSGKQRTAGYTAERFSDNQLARVIYNNGRLWEGSVQKGSEIYNEIMVTM